jgi:hypothetical protein
MSQANVGLTPEQIKKNREILNDHRVFIDMVQHREITPEMEQKIADFLISLDADDNGRSEMKCENCQDTGLIEDVYSGHAVIPCKCKTEITEEDLNSCWNPSYHTTYLAQILTGTYSLQSAREDIRSLIGSKYDSRSKP